ncbi:MAG: alkyl sulfatase dimerization domain-containing protein [Candidatus Promineifilaceae bacterium]|nr:alkyl sulfatase dimerization domain-containing protein [Candidatus Promineifilaceae bacterium]
MNEFHQQTAGDESGTYAGRSRRFQQLLIFIALGTLLLLLIGFVARSGAQDAAQGANEAENSIVAFLPVVTSPEVFGGPVPVIPKPATDTTIAANAAVLNELPFGDTSDYDDVARDFIAPLPDTVLIDDKGNTIWDPGKFDFIVNMSDAPDSVNPSLWRQAQLVNTSGLFKVTDRIYQVRNYDLSNMTIIEGDTGLIIVDPLVSVETAKAALDLYLANRPAKPVVAVIYTHSHVDHWGGVLGVTTQQDVANGIVDVYAPEGFLSAASKENVYAGNAMGRRANYMYGTLIPARARGSVGSGLGMTLSEGTKSLIAPTVTIDDSTGSTVIDGLTFEWLMAPNSEAPSEMLWYNTELKAMNGAEDATHTLHNTYSLRGAKVRDPLAWSKYLNEALVRWGGDVEVLYNMHHWPVWTNAEVVDHLKLQRDLYRFINDQTLNLANRGYVPVEIAEMIELPEVQQQTWSSRGYYGTMNHDVKATYDLYLGWFDGNPANLHTLPPVDASKKYVELMGGAEQVLAAAQEAFDNGDYRWVAQLVNHVVFADPNNRDAKLMQADALEQLGYQAESGPWRNFYLTGAEELRNGVDTSAGATFEGGLEVLSVIELEELFDFLAIHLNASKAEGKMIVLNWVFNDKPAQNDANKFVTNLENSVVNHTQGQQSPDAAATITIGTETLGQILLGQTTIQVAINDGKVTIDGSIVKVIEFFSMLQSFPSNFNIVTP